MPTDTPRGTLFRVPESEKKNDELRDYRGDITVDGVKWKLFGWPSQPLTTGAKARGTPLFRSIAGNNEDGHRVRAERLSERSVARIVKCRAYMLYAARNKTAGKKKLSARDLKAKVEQFSGHMRVGHVTSAAERGAIAAHIQKTTWHKTPQMISMYTRVVDAVKHSSLKGSAL